MDIIEYKRITYGELIEGKVNFEGDNYGIVSDYLTENVINTLLSNPSGNESSKSVMNLIIDNGEIAGRVLTMQTRIKAGNIFIAAQSGFGIEISSTCRGKGLGKKIIKDTAFNSEYPIYTMQLFSSGAAAIVRKLELTVFKKPLYVKLRKTRTVLAVKNMNGFLLNICAFCGDLWLKILDIPNKVKLYKLKQKYIIKKEMKVPKWTESMTLDDGHKYTEMHDCAWLQWTLDNRFTTDPNDKNSFYAVYNKEGLPCGFFMIKERFEKNNEGIFNNLIRGTVVEWGSWNENELTEVELNLMALSIFSPNVDKVNTVISSDGIDDKIKKMGFKYRGEYQMALKPKIAVDSDMYDQKHWRIRYGGSNTIFV